MAGLVLRRKSCKKGYVINPISGRCILSKGRVAQQLRKNGKSPTKKSVKKSTSKKSTKKSVAVPRGGIVAIARSGDRALVQTLLRTKKYPVKRLEAAISAAYGASHPGIAHLLENKRSSILEKRFAGY